MNDAPTAVADARVRRGAPHWPEYGIEFACLAIFMISAGVVTTLLAAASARDYVVARDPALARLAIGVCMGATAIGLIYSPWGRRSGAHMNPAVTFAFWLLGRVRGLDAIAYVIAQLAGAASGVVACALLLGASFTAEPVRWIAARPGSAGSTVAFVVELALAFVMFATVLATSARARWAHLTGVVAGMLVATFITVAAPYSGMSINPARWVASAWPAGDLAYAWIYVLAPLAGMALAARLASRLQPEAGCAKLVHRPEDACIHCGARGDSDATTRTAAREP